MRRVVLAALLVTACRIDLDHAPRTTDSRTAQTECEISTTSVPCMDAVGHSDLTWIQANVFTKQCVFSGCHNGGNTDAGKKDMRAGQSFATLVNAKSRLDDTRKLVVPGNVKQSYLSVMLGHITPAMADPPAGPVKSSVGLMPQDNGGALLCCQKLDAIDAWITAGAMDN
jgi:hypothetical protein